MSTPSYVNWTPVSIPPLKEARYLVWMRQNGSVQAGKIGTFWYYPNHAVWGIEVPFKEGTQIDLWAEIAPPFSFQVTGGTNLDPKK